MSHFFELYDSLPARNCQFSIEKTLTGVDFRPVESYGSDCFSFEIRFFGPVVFRNPEITYFKGEVCINEHVLRLKISMSYILLMH